MDGKLGLFYFDGLRQLLASQKWKIIYFQVLMLGDKLKMGFVALAFLGVILGAAGTELLRIKRPDVIEKIEDAAKHFADSVCPSKSDDEKTKEE